MCSSEVPSQVRLHASTCPRLHLLDLLGMAHALHIDLLLYLVIHELRLLGLVLHGDLSRETLGHLWHCRCPLLLDELEERPEPVLVLEKILDGILVLGNEWRFHESVLRVLDKLSEIDH